MTYFFGNVVRLNPVFNYKYSDLTAMPREFKNRWTVSGDEARTNIPVILSDPQYRRIHRFILPTTPTTILRSASPKAILSA